MNPAARTSSGCGGLNMHIKWKYGVYNYGVLRKTKVIDYSVHMYGVCTKDEREASVC